MRASRETPPVVQMGWDAECKVLGDRRRRLAERQLQDQLRDAALVEANGASTRHITRVNLSPTPTTTNYHTYFLTITIFYCSRVDITNTGTHWRFTLYEVHSSPHELLVYLCSRTSPLQMQTG